jgi:TonB family protein
VPVVLLWPEEFFRRSDCPFICGHFGRWWRAANEKETKISALRAEFNTMNKVNKLAVLAALLGASGLIAGAASPEQSYVKAYEGRAGVPVPVSVVSPMAVTDQAGYVEVQFTVNEKGKPTQISVRSTTDDVFVEPVLAAVADWRFAPVIVNGTPVAKKVVLPFRFVATDSRLASSN